MEGRKEGIKWGREEGEREGKRKKEGRKRKKREEKERKGTPIASIRNPNGIITTGPTEVRRIIRKYIQINGDKSDNGLLKITILAYMIYRFMAIPVKIFQQGSVAEICILI